MLIGSDMFPKDSLRKVLMIKLQFIYGSNNHHVLNEKYCTESYKFNRGMMNPSQFMYYDNGMMNFNCFQNYMVDDIKNMLYMKILQDNITLREELNRRDQQEKSSYQLRTEPSHQQQISNTKVEFLSRQEEQSEVESEVRSADFKINKSKKLRKNPRNETKNIPKNFGKAIISFIEQNKELTRRILSNFPQVQYSDFIAHIRSRKRKINSISDLRDLWGGMDNPFDKPLRILSNTFLRKYSLQYIFNSRISNYSGHIKYRTRLLEALEDPEKFTNIKHY